MIEQNNPLYVVKDLNHRLYKIVNNNNMHNGYNSIGSLKTI